MEEIGQMSVELLFGLIALLTSTKILGKTQISQVTPFDFISAIVLGELVGNAIYDPEVNVLSIMYAVILWTLFIYLILVVTQKFRSTRKLFEGNPSIIIRNGRIDLKELRTNKMDINELQQMLRQQKDIFSLREVEFAILEPNGKISALKKPKYASPTVYDLNIAQTKIYLPVSIISDGKVDQENLKTAGFDEHWLKTQLLQENINRVEDVLFADWIEEEGLYYQKI